MVTELGDCEFQESEDPNREATMESGTARETSSGPTGMAANPQIRASRICPPQNAAESVGPATGLTFVYTTEKSLCCWPLLSSANCWAFVVRLHAWSTPFNSRKSACATRFKSSW